MPEHVSIDLICFRLARLGKVQKKVTRCQHLIISIDHDFLSSRPRPTSNDSTPEGLTSSFDSLLCIALRLRPLYEQSEPPILYEDLNILSVDKL